MESETWFGFKSCLDHKQLFPQLDCEAALDRTRALEAPDTVCLL